MLSPRCGKLRPEPAPREAPLSAQASLRVFSRGGCFVSRSLQSARAFRPSYWTHRRRDPHPHGQYSQEVGQAWSATLSSSFAPLLFGFRLSGASARLGAFQGHRRPRSQPRDVVVDPNLGAVERPLLRALPTSRPRQQLSVSEIFHGSFCFILLGFKRVRRVTWSPGGSGLGFSQRRCGRGVKALRSFPLQRTAHALAFR